MTAGDWALVVLAVFWALLVVFLAFVSLNLIRLLGSTRELLDGVRTETVPLLLEARKTVAAAGRDLDRVEPILVSAGSITRRADRMTTLVGQALETPLIKIIAASAGASRALKRFREGR